MEPKKKFSWGRVLLTVFLIVFVLFALVFGILAWNIHTGEFFACIDGHC